MRLVLITDVFPPLRSSGAVQLRDLATEFVRQGHEPTVLVASPDLDCGCIIDEIDGVRIVRLKTPKTKDVGYVRRTIAEYLMPYAMLWNLWRSAIAKETWDGVVWYSPTIFLGPVARALKRAGACRSYLIIRDIFPDWAVDMGLMGKGLPYRFFKAIEKMQYDVADVIGVQTAGNLKYFETRADEKGQQIEVLENWLGVPQEKACRISVENTSLAGRKIFVYAGNMGVAQGLDIIIDLALRMTKRRDIGFLFVGRGSDVRKLRLRAESLQLDNILFHDEIDSDEISSLYKQCHVGIVALDRRHKTHNIPGKFLTYMQAGLPVFAVINPGNDLEGLIKNAGVGRVCTDENLDALELQAVEIVDQVLVDEIVAHQCAALSRQLFSPEVAVRKITKALTPVPVADFESYSVAEYGNN
jgi:glycosyltransferase involved in cell wall biosynthesis